MEKIFEILQKTIAKSFSIEKIDDSRIKISTPFSLPLVGEINVFLHQEHENNLYFSDDGLIHNMFNVYKGYRTVLENELDNVLHRLTTLFPRIRTTIRDGKTSFSSELFDSEKMVNVFDFVTFLLIAGYSFHKIISNLKDNILPNYVFRKADEETYVLVSLDCMGENDIHPLSLVNYFVSANILKETTIIMNTVLSSGNKQNSIIIFPITEGIITHDNIKKENKITENVKKTLTKIYKDNIISVNKSYFLSEEEKAKLLEDGVI